MGRGKAIGLSVRPFYFLLMCTTGLLKIVNIASLIAADARCTGYVLHRAPVFDAVNVSLFSIENCTMTSSMIKGTACSIY